jgi:CRP-like cAMP-binding protein
MDMQKLLKLVAEVDFLREVDPNILMELIPLMKETTYKRGDCVIETGKSGDEFFLISSGKVSVWILKGDKKLMVAELTDGKYFGEMALLTNEPRSATVMVDMDTVIYSLSKKNFYNILSKHPDVYNIIKQKFTERATQNVTLKKNL